MRFRNLLEAEHNFGDTATDVLDKVGKLAGGAYHKFKSAYTKSKDEIDAAQERAAKAAEKANGKSTPAGDLATKAVNMVVTDQTTREDVDALALDASQFQELLNVVKKLEIRLSQTPVILKKAILASGFVVPKPGQPHDLDERIADQAAKLLPAAELKLSKNEFDEQGMWQEVLTADPEEAGRAFITGIRNAQQANHKHNLGIQGQQYKGTSAARKAGNAVVRPEGTALINILSTERQVLRGRIADFKTLITDMEQHPTPVAEGIQRLAAKAKRRL